MKALFWTAIAGAFWWVERGARWVSCEAAGRAFAARIQRRARSTA